MGPEERKQEKANIEICHIRWQQDAKDALRSPFSLSLGFLHFYCVTWSDPFSPPSLFSYLSNNCSDMS